MRPTAYLLRIWDAYASSHGDWDNESVCLTLDDAKAEQARLAKLGHRTNILPLKLVQAKDTTHG